MNIRLSTGLACALAAAALGLQSCSSDCPNCPGGPASLTISPKLAYTPSVIPGDSVRLQVDLRDSKGRFLPLLGRTVSWQSLDNAVATVNSDTANGFGQVKGVVTGDARIVATVAGLEDTAHVLVVTTSTFSQQVYPILVTTCGTGGCHIPISDPNVPGATGPQPAMNTVRDTLYNTLLTSSRGYITAGDTTMGLLLARTRDVGAVGGQMPPALRLSLQHPGNYHLIALWIAQGALNN